MPEQEVWRPIDAVAKDGKTRLMRAGPTLMVAYWTGDMWAYDLPNLVQQVDIDPREYRP